jgi:hypothetical protein
LLRSHEPPPVTIDLVDEAQRGPQEIHWSVRHIRGTGAAEQYETYRGVSSIRYQADDDTFEMRVRLSRSLVGEPREAGGAFLPIKSLDSVYSVTREGILRRVDFRLVFDGGLLDAVFKGEVRDGKFYGHYDIKLPGQPDLRGDPEPVPVSSSGSILNPLHPVKRIKNIRPGQTWLQPQVNPLRDALRALAAQRGFGKWLEQDSEPILDAAVLPEAQTLRWNGRDMSCWVIEYKEKGELRARTWVETESGIVLRQEAIGDGEAWEFQRDSGIE